MTVTPMNHPRRAVVASLALLLCLAGAAACGAKDAPGTGGSPTPSGKAALGTSQPTASATPTALAPNPSAYPTTPEAYAKAVLAKWKQKDLDGLADLTTAQVHEQIIEIPGPPNQDWTFRDCEDDATVWCGFFNAVGDWISVRIDKDKLGKAHAASAVEFDATVYPDDAVEYVKAFVLAWQFGNKARMLQLSKASVVNQLALGSPPDGESYPVPTCCGGGLVQVVVQWGGGSVTFDVGSTLLGTPHAIVGYTL
jgi:hypothetical protein